MTLIFRQIQLSCRTEEQIKSIYERVCIRFHPFHNKQQEEIEKFEQVNTPGKHDRNLYGQPLAPPAVPFHYPTIYSAAPIQETNRAHRAIDFISCVRVHICVDLIFFASYIDTFIMSADVCNQTCQLSSISHRNCLRVWRGMARHDLEKLDVVSVIHKHKKRKTYIRYIDIATAS